MLYDLDIPKLIRRYAPTWFRWPENLSLAYVLCYPLVGLHTRLMQQRATVLAHYRYGPLKHSLEAMLNDRYDPIARRIFIDVPPQLPVLFFQEPEEPPVTYLRDPGMMTGYYHLDEADLNAAGDSRYEFTVNVPASISFVPRALFDDLDEYRFAGRRPAIRRFEDSDPTDVVQLIYYT